MFSLPAVEGGNDGRSKAVNGNSNSNSNGNSNSNSNSNGEIKFGKHLASSDKRVRDRTVAALREWLRQRSRGGSLTDLDLLKACTAVGRPRAQPLAVFPPLVYR